MSTPAPTLSAIPGDTAPSVPQPGPYESLDFWRAYNTLHYHKPEHAEVFAKSLSLLLNEKQPVNERKKPLHILILGGGCGTIELPVLGKLAADFPSYTFEVHVLEKSKTALAIFRSVVSSANWLNDPVGSALGVKETPKSLLNLNDVNTPPFLFHFHELDLDFEFDSGVGPCPSKWDKNFSQVQFDIVFAAFTLFHLQYWQSTLCRALSLLKAGGLFLHPRTSGDESIWERNLCRDQARAPIASGLFSKLYENPKARDFAIRPKGNTASFPGQITSMLQFLESAKAVAEQYSSSKDLLLKQYRISCGTPTFETYITLLAIRGFGLFRRLEAAIGPAEYSKALDEVGSLRPQFNNVTDQALEIQIIWDVYTLADGSNRELIAMLGGFESSPEAHNGDTALLQSQFNLFQRQTAYQVSGFYLDAHLSTNAQQADEQVELLRNTLIRRLQTERLLHPKATIGQMWIEKRHRASPGQQKSERQVTCFSNPHFAARTPKMMMDHVAAHARFLRLLSSRRHRTFSNITILLDELMPALKKPCVFRYHAPDAGADVITWEEEADFYLIGFRPLLDSTSAEPLKASFPEPRLFLKFDGEIEPRSAVNEVVKATLEALAKILSKGGPVLHELNLALAGSCADCGQPSRIEAMAETIWCLNPLFDGKHVKDVLFIPACYATIADDGTAKVEARDLLILSYSEQLSSAEVAEEFERYNMIYDSIGLRRAQSDLATWVDSQLQKQAVAVEVRDRVRLALDPTSTKDDWLRLLYSNLWFTGDHHRDSGAAQHLGLLQAGAKALGVKGTFPQSVDSAKSLFLKDVSELPVADLCLFLNGKADALDQECVYLPFYPGIVWLRTITKLKELLAKDRLLTEIDLSSLNIRKGAKHKGECKTYVCVSLNFTKQIDPERMYSLQDGIRRAGRMTPDQWKADAEGDFRRAVASVLHCWLENYTPKSRDEDHEPFVTVDCGALHVGWLTAKTKLSGPRPVAAGTPTTWTTLVADRIADGWPGTPTKGITVCGKDELAVLHAGRSKFDLVFIHLDEASDIEKAAEMCNLALFRFSRGGRIELRDVASIQAPECYFLSEAVGPKYLFPMIVALGNARNQARVLATAIESLRSQHPILNKLMPNPRGNQ